MILIRCPDMLLSISFLKKKIKSNFQEKNSCEKMPILDDISMDVSNILRITVFKKPTIGCFFFFNNLNLLFYIQSLLQVLREYWILFWSYKKFCMSGNPKNPICNQSLPTASTNSPKILKSGIGVRIEIQTVWRAEGHAYLGRLTAKIVSYLPLSYGIQTFFNWDSLHRRRIPESSYARNQGMKLLI